MSCVTVIFIACQGLPSSPVRLILGALHLLGILPWCPTTNSACLDLISTSSSQTCSPSSLSSFFSNDHHCPPFTQTGKLHLVPFPPCLTVALEVCQLFVVPSVTQILPFSSVTKLALYSALLPLFHRMAATGPLGFPVRQKEGGGGRVGTSSSHPFPKSTLTSLKPLANTAPGCLWLQGGL